MVRKLVVTVVVLAVIAAGVFWLLTAPREVAASAIPAHAPDVANGELMFWVGGCESCHAPAGAQGDDRLKLGGGQVLSTPFGDFVAPNISPDPDHGIGGWTTAQFVTAMKLGIAPGGIHLYPAFPYPSYQRMRPEDLIDLKAFLDTLPAVADASGTHSLAFPYNIRRGIGLWQRLHVDGDAFAPDPTASDEVNRGAYLVQGPGHCGECHSPRDFTGAAIPGRALAGAAMLDGTGGYAPNLTSDASGLGDWSQRQIVRLLSTGLKPNFDAVGGAMGPVVQNLSMLSPSDLQAIAAYLMSLKPLPATPRPAAPPQS